MKAFTSRIRPWRGLFLWLAMAIGAGTAAWAGLPADIEIVVVDDQDEPVEGATVSMAFVVSDEDGEVVGVTDSNGWFRAGTTSSDGGAYFGVSKPEYYPTAGEYEFRETEGGRWTSGEKPIQVLLRFIEDPVPMYARNVQTTIPQENLFVGYDLEVGDWTRPHGDGRTRDLLFKFTKRYVAWSNFDVMLDLEFSNPNDGIQEVRWPFKSWLGSRLRLPRFAPENGYATNWSLGFGADPRTGYYNVDRPDDINYFFRVRTRTNEYGVITNAWYGKIHGNFSVEGYGTDQTGLKFRYYVNPDGTRNMEFDPERNLSLNLGRWEGVAAP